MPRLWHVLVGLAFSGFLVISVAALAKAVSENAWTTYAQQLDGAATLVEPSPDIRRALNARLDTSPRACGIAADRIQASLALYILRLALRPGSPIEDRASAVAIAARALRFSLSCRPSEGGLWSALAYVEHLQGTKADRLKDILGLSQRLSPVESATLSVRAALATQILGDPAHRVDPRLHRDLAQALRVLRPAEAGRLVVALRAGGNGVLADRLLATLPPDRRLDLARSEGRVLPDPEPFERYRHFEFDPFDRSRAKN